jgi:hypothetical protein
MAEELDTSSWFDLKNYEPLKTMSIEGWASVLESRAYCQEVYDYDAKQEDREWTLQAIADELKAGYFSVDPFVDTYINEDFAKEMLRGHSFSKLTVDSLRNYQAWDMAEDRWPPQEWSAAFQKKRDEWQKPCEDGENKDGLQEIADAPYDFRFKQYMNIDYIPSSAHVVISLDAPDEQIKNDFSHWLTHYRKSADYHVQKKLAHKKLFTQKTFDYWIEYSLIPYLDLDLIAKIEGKKILQRQMADLIFPNPVGFTSIERLRDTTIPEAKRLMEQATRWSLVRQVANEKLTRTKNT